MLVVSKMIVNGDQIFNTFDGIENALLHVENSDDKDIELLVDFSELKNYKEKYEEIYSTLFKDYTDIENRDYKEFSNIIFTVKYILNHDYSRSQTFSSLSDATSFIEDFDDDSEDFSAQLLVNVSEVQDYKEKYEEFYSLMLNSYKEKKKYVKTY